MTKIHPTAIVEDGAVIGAEVEIGAFCVVGRDVRLAPGVRLAPHVVVEGETEIGAGTIVHSHAVLGGPAQFRAEAGTNARLKIGANNIIREHVTMNCGTAKGGGQTSVGDRGYFMAYSHVGHDCHVGNGVTFANGAALGGHVTVEDGVNIGGLSAILQFVRIGRDAFVGGLSGVPADIIPYGLVQGSRARLEALNLIGLKRKGVPRDRIHALRAAYRFIFFGEGPLVPRVREAGERWKGVPEVDEVVGFVMADSKRPLCVPVQGARNAKDADKDSGKDD